MAELYEDSPCCFLDRPYTYTDRALDYYVQEYQELIHFMEQQTGRKMDYDRLKEIVRSSYRVTELCMEINELRKTAPSPFPCEGIFAQMAVLWLYGGTKEAEDFFEMLRDEVRQRVDQQIGVVPDERFRLLIPFTPPFWDMAIMDWMQDEHGAVIAMDLLNTWGEDGKWLLDPEKPLENLARKTFLHPACYQLHGPLEPYIESRIQNALEYKIDGAVFFSHIGCRQACACIRALKDELQERVGIPMAIVDCDIVDKSFTSREEVKEKLDGFFERMEEQKEMVG